MLSQDFYDGQTGTRYRRLELERTGPSSAEYRRFDAPDFVTPSVTRPATSEELAMLENHEDGQESERSNRGPALRQAAENIITSTPNGNDIITLFVGLGLVTPKQARSAGWTPPP